VPAQSAGDSFVCGHCKNDGTALQPVKPFPWLDFIDGFKNNFFFKVAS
jgi:hypothetical protein